MASFSKTLKQGTMYPYRLMKGRLSKAAGTSEQVRPGEGAIVDVNGKKVAVYKDADGKTITLSPACPHLGCMVEWNAAEKAWDCPCHASRFSADGKVMKGPATKDLERLQG
jgi:Rieske Fe-S protein